MKRPLRRFIIEATVFILVCIAVVFGAAWLMLDYALRPQMQTEAQAWAEAESYAPAVGAWADSLRAARALRDTTVAAPDGTRLHAWYVRSPRARGRTAVLLHGYSCCAPVMMHLGRMYEHDLGYNILLPDLRHAGRSGGSYVGMGWPDRLDALLWVRLTPQLFGHDARVVVHGVSMGAATAMMASGEPAPPALRAYVEDCGYTSVDAQFRKEIGSQFGLPAWPLVPTASLLCRLRHGWSFSRASALRAVSRCRLPMLFIHGSADDYVPTDMVRPLYNAKPQPKALWVVPGAKHAQSYATHPEEYTRRVAAFLEPYMH